MKMGMMKIFSILLTFYHKLVLQEGIFATAASLIPYFAIIISPCYDEVTLCRTATVSTNFFFVSCFFVVFFFAKCEI